MKPCSSNDFFFFSFKACVISPVEATFATTIQANGRPDHGANLRDDAPATPALSATGRWNTRTLSVFRSGPGFAGGNSDRPQMSDSKWSRESNSA
jgi:hypothetical protein